MAVKNRMFLLKEYLEEYSDETHPVTTAQIRKYLKDNGCDIIIRTLRADIQSMIDHGYEIEVTEKEGRPTTYGWVSRPWSMPEIQILIDAVSSSQFLTREKSRQLMDKLTGMASPSARKDLQPQILISERVKAPNKQILYIVQAIRKAIRNDRKITFRYYHYQPDTEQETKRSRVPEEAQTVSPYATIWNNDRYYLIGWSDKRKKISAYRIDRMDTPKQTAGKRVPEPEGFNVQDYTDRIFSMYEGPDEEVTLRCRHAIMDQVIDKFGEQVEIRNVQRETFDITVPVSISNTFYAWVFQFVGEMNILSPGHVKDAYAEYLQEAIDDVLGT